MKAVFTTDSKEETREKGEALGRLVKRPLAILLYGDLGAGKTTFTQGLAKGLGVSRRVTSPTFNILKIYKGRMPLYHIDAYRLEGVRQDLGLEEYLEDSDGVTVVEWPMYIQYVLPDCYLRIELRILENGAREFAVESAGEKEEELEREWLG